MVATALLALLLGASLLALGGYRPRQVSAATPAASNLLAGSYAGLSASAARGLQYLKNKVYGARMSAALAGTISGNVFRDFDANGANAGAGEPGVQGIEVRAFNAAGTNVTPGTVVTTDASGNYSIATTDVGSGPYRVEFTIPAALNFLFSGPFGAGSGTSVQFVSAAPAANINLGVANPNDFCVTNPPIGLACYLNGTGVGRTEPAWVTFPYSATGLTNQNIYHPTTEIQDLGTVWGASYQRATQLMFTAAFLKRHSGFGPRGVDGVYAISYSNPAAPTMIGGFDLQGVMPSNGGAPIDVGSVTRTSSGNGPITNDTDLSNDPGQPNRDLDAFAKVGRISYGDIEVSEDGQFLWLVNLNQRTLIRVDLDQVTISGANPNLAPSSAVNSYSIIGAPGVPACTNGQFRPWAIKFQDGQGYLGGVCSAENGSTAANLQAYVLQFNPANPTTFTSVLSFALNYNRETAGGAGAGSGWVLEGTAGSCPVSDPGPSGSRTDDGPSNNGEFYPFDLFVITGAEHFEISLGGLTLVKGKNEVVTIAFDPLTGAEGGTTFTQGVNFYNTTTGGRRAGYQIIGNEGTATFGKAAGLGEPKRSAPLRPSSLATASSWIVTRTAFKTQTSRASTASRCCSSRTVHRSARRRRAAMASTCSTPRT